MFFGAPDGDRRRARPRCRPRCGHGHRRRAPGGDRRQPRASLSRDGLRPPVRVSPIEASSGTVTRHRLNRGGDRRANHALWRIVMVRMVSDPDTRAYVERRTKEGRSKREICGA